MAPHERIALRAGFIGVRAELNGAEAYAERAASILKPFFQLKSEPLAKEKLHPKGIPEGECADRQA
jgi:hypothetical protein